jgi:hypothetical protein
MAQDIAAEQYAEAPPNDPMHPAIVERLAQDADALAANFAEADARSMAADIPWVAMGKLREELGCLMDEAEMYRPSIA